MKLDRAALVGSTKWCGRVTAFLLLLFWAAFFLEHLSEWFLRSDGLYPPSRVWISQIFHGLMVVGLLMMLKWDRVGAILLLAGTAGFFGTMAMRNPWPLGFINLIPVAFFSLYWLARRMNYNEH